MIDMYYTRYLLYGLGVFCGCIAGNIISRIFPTFTLGVILPLMVLLFAGLVTLEITGKMTEWAWSDEWLP